MAIVRALLYVALLLSSLNIQPARAQAQQQTPAGMTIQVTSRLVFLDVTVLDKDGHPVVKGLTQDDFVITEDKRPQRTFSFEAPETHGSAPLATSENPSDEAPVTILVLDLLNSRFQDFAYIRYQVRKYLDTQPEQLASPCELLVLGNNSLQLLEGYTRSKSDLVTSLEHAPVATPYKLQSGSFTSERFSQSVYALEEIALQNRGVPGRKNIIWVGHGAPNLFSQRFDYKTLDAVNRYMHQATNMLVDARISLFVIYPGLQVSSNADPISALSAGRDMGDGDPFMGGDINFGVLVNETGGKLFYNRNDVDAEIARSQQLGAAYYTLTYRPQGGAADGKFRRIRVTMRDPSLQVMTKTGYFAPSDKDAVDPRQEAISNIFEAARSTISPKTLDMTIKDVVRHPDAGTVQFTVLLRSKNLGWQSQDNGKSTAKVMFATVSLSGRKDILASRMETLTIVVGTQDATMLARTLTTVPVTIRVPRRTDDIRVVVQRAEGGQVYVADLSRKTVDAAQEANTPEPTQAPPTP